MGAILALGLIVVMPGVRDETEAKLDALVADVDARKRAPHRMRLRAASGDKPPHDRVVLPTEGTIAARSSNSPSAECTRSMVRSGCPTAGTLLFDRQMTPTADVRSGWHSYVDYLRTTRS